jgi:hypothetical protein
MNAAFRVFVFFLLSTPGIITAQTLEIKGIIRDQNKIGIAYATISIKNKAEGCIADEKGNYQLTVTPKDTLIILAPKYEPAIISMKNTAVLSPLFIYLTSKDGQIKTIENTLMFQRPTIEGLYNQPPGATFTSLPGQSIVMKIDNSIKKEALLSKIHARFDKKNLIQNKLRIRIFSVNPLTGEPFNDLLTENIIVAVTSSPFSFDIESYRIAIPAEGCFVGFDWIAQPETEKKSPLSTTASAKSDGITPCLKTTSKVCIPKTYSRIFASEWRSWTSQSGNCPSNALIAATLKY